MLHWISIPSASAKAGAAGEKRRLVMLQARGACRGWRHAGQAY